MNILCVQRNQEATRLVRLLLYLCVRCVTCCRDNLLYVLHRVGAKRCPKGVADCNDGCSTDGTFDGVAKAKEICVPVVLKKGSFGGPCNLRSHFFFKNNPPYCRLYGNCRQMQIFCAYICKINISIHSDLVTRTLLIQLFSTTIYMYVHVHGVIT